MFLTKNLRKYSQNSNKMLTNKSGEIQVMLNTILELQLTKKLMESMSNYRLCPTLPIFRLLIQLLWAM